MNGKLSVIGSSTYMWKVMQLPMEFFSQRMASDVFVRMDMLKNLTASVTNICIPLVMNTVTAVLCLILMLKHSLTMTAVSVSVLTVNLFLSRLIARTHENAVRVMERDKEKLSSATLSGLSMIETIKVSGAETSYFEKWAGLQAAVNTQRVRAESAERILSRIPDFMSGAAYFIVMIMGIYYVMQGSFTLGMVWMFQGSFSALMSPVFSVSGAGKQIQTMRTQFERAEDILQYPPDKSLTDRPACSAGCQSTYFRCSRQRQYIFTYVHGCMSVMYSAFYTVYHDCHRDFDTEDQTKDVSYSAFGAYDEDTGSPLSVF